LIESYPFTGMGFPGESLSQRRLVDQANRFEW